MSAATSTAVAPPRRVPPFRRLGLLVLALPGLAFLSVFFVWPVLQLLTLSIYKPGVGLTGAFSARAIDTPVYLRVLQITFTVALQTAILCVALGYPLAYWLARLPARRRASLIILVLIPFWTSGLVKAFSWMILLDRSGIVNAALLQSGLVDQPAQILGTRLAVLVGMVHSMMPLAVMTMLPVMLSIDRRLPLAAGTLGAPPGQVFWRVFFHLSLPGVAAAGLLVFIISLGFFISPALLGGPRDTMLGQLIIQNIQELLNWGFAGALAAILIVSALIAGLVYDRLFGISSIAGQASTARRGGAAIRVAGMALLAALGTGQAWLGNLGTKIWGRRGQRLLLPIFCTLLILFLIVPTAIIVPMAFTSASYLAFPPPGFGLEWFRTYLDSPIWISATVRSFAVAAGTAVLATVLGGFAALALTRASGRAQAAIFGLFITPMIVPHIVIAVGLFYVYTRFGLVGTDLGLVLGHTVFALPLAFLAITAMLKGYDRRLDQAAATLAPTGCEHGVVTPLLRGGIIAALLLPS